MPEEMEDSNPYAVLESLHNDLAVSNPWSTFLTIIAQTLCICLAPTPVLFGLLSFSDTVAQSNRSRALVELLALLLSLIISGVIALFLYRYGNRVAPILGLGIWVIIALAAGVRFLST
jgi:hypothetical protein